MQICLPEKKDFRGAETVQCGGQEEEGGDGEAKESSPNPMSFVLFW
jgi:hypothetical protein